MACCKALSVGLPLLMPQRATGAAKWAYRATGAAVSPFLVLLAPIPNFSMARPDGDDCLGETGMACRAGASAGAAESGGFAQFALPWLDSQQSYESANVGVRWP